MSADISTVGAERPAPKWFRPTAPKATARAILLMSGCLPLLACGTDVEWLLRRDSLLVARADELAMTADAIDPDLATEMYDAEEDKQIACERIYASVAEQMTIPSSFGEELATDLGAFIAYLFPVHSVERCAEAQSRYQAAVDGLALRLAALAETNEQPATGDQ
jgi:hypothetical protein